MKYLRNHLNEVQEQLANNNNDNNDLLKSEIIKSTKVFDLG